MIGGMDRSRWLLPGLGALVTPILGVISWAFMGSGHGTYLPMALFFPWAMLVAVLSSYVTVSAIAVGIVQWPLYGVILSWRKSNRSKRIVKALFCLHAIAIVLASMLDTDRVFPMIR